MFATLNELHMDDKVIPLSTKEIEAEKVLTVIDIHPLSDDVVGAVTLWDGNREFTSRTLLFKVISRYWD